MKREISRRATGESVSPTHIYDGISMRARSDIRKAIQSLAEEARKYKSVGEFGNAVAIKRTMMQVRQVRTGVGFVDDLIGGISQTAFSTEETIQQLEELLKKHGYSSFTDFYNQAQQRM